MEVIDYSEINKTVEVLEGGGIILYPTDTIWGIGCDATNEIAIQKIFELKQRNVEKSLIVLLAEAKDIFNYVAYPPINVFSIIQSFDYPTTIVFEQALGLPDNLIAKDGSVGIRIVKDDFCKALIKQLKKPMVSTSANISGEQAAKSYHEVSDQILRRVDYAVQHRRDEVIKKESSDVIRLSNEGTYEYIRRAFR